MQRSGDRELEAAIVSGRVPGAVALVTGREETLYCRAFGEADATTGVPMREDTIFQIASMTKAVTSAAALQLVERGLIDLHAPIGRLVPELAAPQVLEGFDDAGKPLLRPARREITLHHLLTHTSGISYSFVSAELLRWQTETGHPQMNTRAGLAVPLVFEVGERWEYGLGTDWTGLVVEAVTGLTLGDWLAAELTGPLGMNQTRFRAREEMPADAAKIHARLPGGGFATVPMNLGSGEFHSGGGGLSSTAPDYARFLRMVLNEGELDGVRVLKPESVAEMKRDALAAEIDQAGVLRSAQPQISADFDPLPGMRAGWSHGGFLINPETGPAGRSPGSLHWAGIFNTYFWIDPARERGGILMAQVTPFADPGVLGAWTALERMACAM